MYIWKKWKKAAAFVLAFLILHGQAIYAAEELVPITVAPDTVSADETSLTGQDSALQEPEIAAQGACLMDAATGQVLFGKNQDQQFYPASITKVMTALLVLERCRLDETVTFSENAVTNLGSGAVTLDISAGDQLTVEQALYGLLLKSANEIGNGLAEHVSGSIEAFASLMNEKAASLGCRATNFVNPHGMPDPSHKTTPYDMCLILRAALQNDDFRRIDTTVSYQFPAVKASGERAITMGHKMMNPSDSRYYPGIIGGKTGYTQAAGNTLVTGVERDGIRLVAAVMKSSGTHYQDTKAMLDYGFENYARLTGRDPAAVPSIEDAASETAASPMPGNSIGPGGSAGIVEEPANGAQESGSPYTALPSPNAGDSSNAVPSPNAGNSYSAVPAPNSGSGAAKVTLSSPAESAHTLLPFCEAVSAP